VLNFKAKIKILIEITHADGFLPLYMKGNTDHVMKDNK
jgi:hypothetical protein